MIVFFTYMVMMLKNLSPVEHSFERTLHLCMDLAKSINEDISGNQPLTSITQLAQQQFQKDFNKFFISHLLRKYCTIMKESSNKRQFICELIFAHCQHEQQLRINVVKSFKKYLVDDEIVYSAHAFFLQNETEFNEQWFDVFLYYALIGLNNPKISIRVCSLNVLNTIAVHNAQSILDITEKVHKLSLEKHWEIKAQCLEFAITILS
mmetsp:Transcript_14285/g.22239  ORF Transcript_14285/g.22239 Transcript_14285/m.22239 type:complete len:207 (+) Transcript_14285:1105-1725(+)